MVAFGIVDSAIQTKTSHRKGGGGRKKTFRFRVRCPTILPRYGWNGGATDLRNPHIRSRRNKVKSNKGIQFLMNVALLIVAGYGLQLKTFVETFTDFSTLFFWAFAP